MLGQPFIILSEDEGLERIVAGLLPGVRVVFCDSVDQHLSGLACHRQRILLDPLSATPRRLEEIRLIEQGVDASRILGAAASIGQNGRGRRPSLSARSAWANRLRVLNPTGRSRAVRSFLRSARENDHLGFSVPAAAASTGVSLRQLYRLSWGALSLPPGVIIDLTRVVSVADAVEGSALPMMTIARVHGFTDQPAMNRQFMRFVGEPPTVRRAHAVLQRLRGLCILAENANGRGAQDGVLMRQ